ncbi:hypothetical protein V8E36_009400 [Tilletia maclaganii]
MPPSKMSEKTRLMRVPFHLTFRPDYPKPPRRRGRRGRARLTKRFKAGKENNERCREVVLLRRRWIHKMDVWGWTLHAEKQERARARKAARAQSAEMRRNAAKKGKTKIFNQKAKTTRRNHVSSDEDDSEDPVSFLADLVDDTVIYEHDAEVPEPASELNMYIRSLQPPAGQRPADWATREALSFWTPTANLMRREDRYPAQDKATIEYERCHGLRE